MKSVNSFIKALSANYYSEFLTDAIAEEIDFHRYFLPVNYLNHYYYELKINEIHLKRREIIDNVKKLYQNALSQIYIELSSQDPDNFDSFLAFNIEAVKLQLKILRADFYVDDKQSRYFSVIDDNPNLQELIARTHDKTSSNEIEIDKKIFDLISDSKFRKVESIYFLEDIYKRSKALSFLPLSLFVIGHDFVVQLKKIQQIVFDLKEEKAVNPKINWIGKKTHIGYILGTLALNGFIDAPKNKNGEINYTAYAKLIKQNFNAEISEESLRKYLNPEDDKFEENKKSFDKAKYHLPNIIEVS